MVRAPEGFADFVAGRSSRLLRTAYLLTQDGGVAEDLLQTAIPARGTTVKITQSDEVPSQFHPWIRPSWPSDL